jgi:hypothetical protein
MAFVVAGRKCPDRVGRAVLSLELRLFLILESDCRDGRLNFPSFPAISAVLY